MKSQINLSGKGKKEKKKKKKLLLLANSVFFIKASQL